MSPQLDKSHGSVYTRIYPEDKREKRRANRRAVAVAGARPAMTAAMPRSIRICGLLATVLAIGCRDRGAAGPDTDELSKLSPEVYSHADEASVKDAGCLAQDGVLI